MKRTVLFLAAFICFILTTTIRVFAERDLETGVFLSRDPAGFVDGPNLYAYVRQNPWTAFDPEGLYEEAGHFYATYMVAKAAGFSEKRAMTTAYYSQYPDEHASTSAWSGLDEWSVRVATDNHQFQDTQIFLHSLHGSKGEGVTSWRNGLKELVSDPSQTDIARGLFIHAMGDSYAHTKKVETTNGNGEVVKAEMAYRFPFGHVKDGHSPDVVSNRPELFKRYAGALGEALSNVSGKSLDQGQMKAIFNMVDGLDKGSEHGEADIAAFRKLAQDKFDYKNSYQPEKSAKESSAEFRELTQKEVNDATFKIWKKNVAK